MDQKKQSAAEFLTEQMSSSGLNRQQVADASGISATRLGDILGGSNPTDAECNSLATACGCSAQDIKDKLTS